MSFFNELKRRNVFRVAAAYAIVAWLLLQISDTLVPALHLPAWFNSGVAFVLILGFPIAVIFAWVFEMTPDGVRRESEVDRSASVTVETGRKLDRVIIGVLVVALVYFVWESRFEKDVDTPSGTVNTPAQSVTGQNSGTSPDVLTTSTSVDNSVAVLPFLNMSSDPEQEYFSDGITEEIINALVKIPGLSVPARTSVFAFKGANRDIRGIGQELGVAHVLEGSIRSQNNQVRITAQLINVGDGFHLWSETFDRELSNIFKVQEEIAAAIAKVLVGELGLAPASAPVRTSNMHAYDMYLQGRALLRARGDEDLVKAIALFENVIALDQEFTPAWAARAIAYQVSSTTLAEEMSTLELTRQALARDPENVDTLTALAAGLRGTYQWAEAEQVFNRALAIDPQSAELLEDYAEFLASVGRLQEYLQVAERGYSIDPYLKPLIHAYLWALMADGQHQKVQDVFDNNPSQNWVKWLQEPVSMFELALSTGHISLATEQVGLVKDESVEAEVRAASIALLENPNNTEALQLLRTVAANSSGEVFTDLVVSPILIAAGDLDFILDNELNKYSPTGVGDPEQLWQPSYAAVRQHPRWGELLEVLKLPEFWDSTSWPAQCQRTNNDRIICE